MTRRHMEKQIRFVFFLVKSSNPAYKDSNEYGQHLIRHLECICLISSHDRSVRYYNQSFHGKRSAFINMPTAHRSVSTIYGYVPSYYLTKGLYGLPTFQLNCPQFVFQTAKEGWPLDRSDRKQSRAQAWSLLPKFLWTASSSCFGVHAQVIRSTC